MGVGCSQVCDRGSWPGGLFPPHGFAIEGELVSVVGDAVEDGIGKRGFAEPAVPLYDRQLAGDQGAAFVKAVVDDFEEVAVVHIGDGREAEVVEDQQAERPHVFHSRVTNLKLNVCLGHFNVNSSY